jgi:hypothetical protein
MSKRIENSTEAALTTDSENERDLSEIALPKVKKAAIVDTSNLALLTGIPGSGKTLRLMELIVALVNEGVHVFVANIKSIAIPGVTRWENPREWQKLPAGAVLVVDEAQDYFPERRGGEPPDYIRELSRIRHYGVRMVLATQQPNYLDTYLRGLVGRHEHLLRSDGKDKTFIFRNQTVMDNIRKPFKVIKNQYDYETWEFNEALFPYYKSADIHTMKYRMPALLKKALMVAPIAIGLIGFVWFMVFREGYSQAYASDGAASETAAPPSSSEGAGSASANAPGRKMDIATAVDYAKALTPLVNGVPWSAPAWVQQQVRSEPHVYCMSTGTKGQDGCRCVTEQNTRFEMPRAQCVEVARWGEAYNPFKAPERTERGVVDEKEQDEEKGAGQRPAAMAAGAAAPVPVPINGDDKFQTRYGQFRGTAPSADPAFGG